ncbi:hypothetical protein PPOLYM_02510 [Paenibacillus polymyxa]|uniref:DUF1064 domain-containing protein n=1 Tax=Paenibacillus polymyxa TaxID=1406 RepID=UPI0009475323|nr:DUF1064 domain-containing protein [Paenibacillus polymyxa]APQ59858.1 phage-like protein [Paenibacillus polymyxa]VUG06117.1 hypothetical protein PPOLYM_02510 [Paenibacillus polymyxa]
MSKYNARKVIVTADGTLFEEWLVKKYNLNVTGIRFDSKMEGEYYQELLLLKQMGEIKDFVCQPKYVLQENPKVTYIADFLVTELDDTQRVIDIKGVETSTFRVKLKLFQTKYPTLRIDILIKKRGEFIPIKQFKKEKADRKRANNKLLKQVEGERKNVRTGRNASQIHRVKK